MAAVKKWITMGQLADAAGVDLTDSEMDTIIWLSQFDQGVVRDLISIFERIRAQASAA